MIVVSVTLLSAIDGTSTELARMHIVNDGSGTARLGNYDCETLRGRSTAALDKHVVNRRGRIESYARLGLHVWNLVARALHRIGYWP